LPVSAGRAFGVNHGYAAQEVLAVFSDELDLSAAGFGEQPWAGRLSGVAPGFFDQIRDLELLCPIIEIVAVKAVALYFYHAENIVPLPLGNPRTHSVPNELLQNDVFRDSDENLAWGDLINGYCKTPSHFLVFGCRMRIPAAARS